MRAARSNDVAPFLPTARDLNRIFHGRSLQRGREVMLAGRVSSMELEVLSSNLMELRAQVLGSEQPEGTEQRRYQVGVRINIDVLNAQQLLLNARVTLVQNLANLITASYGVASAIRAVQTRCRATPA